MEAAIVGALATITLPMALRTIQKNFLGEPDLNSILRELELIQSRIVDPRWKHQKTSGFGRTWIAQLTRLADDIEYSVDNFLIKYTSDSQFAYEISNLKERLEQSSLDLKSHIDEGPSNEEVPPTPVTSTNPEEHLLDLLSGSQSEMKAVVISAIGIGGQNTEMSRRVYDRDDVSLLFSQRAWVSAEDKSLDDLLMEILELLQQGPPSSEFRHQLESRLSKHSYLIVLAGVRTIEVYNEISRFSWANGVGGRIIVTTDIKPVARACMCGDVPLVPDSTTVGLILVGEVGGMLYEDACFTLCAAAVARTEGLLGSDYERVVLEDCLLYFSIFPRDHNVRRNPLIRRCLAEGIIERVKKYLPQNVYRSDEQIVAHHLDILISQNVIQSFKNSDNGTVKRCQPLGLVFNHICNMAVFENFFTLLCGLTQIETAKEANVRRLSLHPYLKDTADGGLRLPNARRLITMVVFPAVGAQYGSILRFDQHKLLRVLDLKECADLNKGHVREICELSLLKYLGLGNSIGSFPRRIRRLKWLETLDMRTTDVVTIYKEVFMLPQLKHLLGKFRLYPKDCPDENRGVLSDFLRLKNEFSELKDLIEKGVLQTLAGVLIGNGKGLPQLLRHMSRLRKVKIWCDYTTNGSTDLTALKEGIKKFTMNGARMSNIVYSLCVDFRESSQSFLDCLEEGGRLTSLKLSGDLTLTPQVSTTKLLISGLQELCLSWTNLSGAAIREGLRFLKCQLKFLKLVEENLVGLKIENNIAPFRSLKRICLVGVSSLDDITIKDLSTLVSLHLVCETLGALPGIQITGLTNLKEVGLHPRVAAAIKNGWEDALKDHQRQPNIVSIEDKIN